MLLCKATVRCIAPTDLTVWSCALPLTALLASNLAYQLTVGTAVQHPQACCKHTNYRCVQSIIKLCQILVNATALWNTHRHKAATHEAVICSKSALGALWMHVWRLLSCCKQKTIADMIALDEQDAQRKSKKTERTVLHKRHEWR